MFYSELPDILKNLWLFGQSYIKQGFWLESIISDKYKNGEVQNQYMN